VQLGVKTGSYFVHGPKEAMNRARLPALLDPCCPKPWGGFSWGVDDIKSLKITGILLC